MTITGGCHCGALTLAFETTKTPAELPVRQCGCTFCTKHRPRYTSDPAGSVAITIRASAVRYRFGLALADFLICGRCGVFVAAYEPGDPGRAVINSAVLAGVELTAAPTTFEASVYDLEDVAARTARRARAWTPATLTITGS